MNGFRSMSSILRFVIIVLVVLVAVVVLAACGEVMCGPCADASCARADRSETARQTLRRILGALGPGVAALFLALGPLLRRFVAGHTDARPSFALAPISALRI
jgi:hypothetical protein